jgi:two-component system cell cycle sensor histidine kinase/response regulator CckA
MPCSSNAPAILLVDDEPSVLKSVCAVLSHFGFDVIAASSPEEALRIAVAKRDPIDLLLSDVLMPGMNGPQLARQILKLHPEAQCLFIAGLPDHPDVMNSILERGIPFLPKPFLPRELVNKVREVLNGGALSYAAGA